MVFRLPEDEIVFPNPQLADPDGLLAVGGGLEMERLLLAYENGIFPWFSEGDSVCWYAPHERCVIFPEKIRISKSMRKLLSDDLLDVTFNKAFARVIVNCAKVERKDQPGTWITDQMQDAYIHLFEKGYAGSVEVWQEGDLVGGLYGVLMGDVFCGESMFSLVSNASKVALIALCKTEKYKLIDCQLPNDHLMSMGAEMISMAEYQDFLDV
ncbi:leucyl/phenylalanyl-tRNA--protein transferase [Pedobacter frigoris]|uniref:Leucyl/phenylalanyl-tRNA--protein transferase n=1 Tax=Pedobacter frigoris TaxID=2571272 RepID=A0A4V5P180_9SPHI|nr:leucyl/phenylalanyl-tRNA--protein transferase [Pedobacter frigoris]TKC05099.1 leucyl/phenylalanyl-tRNA--protein transferase [Pedobacter frigoris]